MAIYRISRYLLWKINRFKLVYYPVRSGKMLSTLMLVFIGLGSLTVLRTIWNALMKGFLSSAPYIAGSQAPVHYWNSVFFTLKCTLIIGAVLLMVMFMLGYRIHKLIRK